MFFYHEDTKLHEALAIYYLLFSIYYCSAFSVYSVANIRAASIVDFLGIYSTFCRIVRIIYNLFVCRM